MSPGKRVHLIGICGTAMASLAGMLKQRGFHVTGSDAAAYPPMSDFLGSLGIPVSQPFTEKNLTPRPDLVVVGNAISRGNAELEHVLDERIPFCSLPQILHDEFLRGKEVLAVAGTHGKRSEEHTSELQSRLHLVCRLLLEKKKKQKNMCHYDRAIQLLPHPHRCSPRTDVIQNASELTYRCLIQLATHIASLHRASSIAWLS